MSRPATDRLKFNAQLGTPPVLQFVAPEQLHVDPTYQRTLDTDAEQDADPPDRAILGLGPVPAAGDRPAR
jgi:hypothetical protein